MFNSICSSEAIVCCIAIASCTACFVHTYIRKCSEYLLVGWLLVTFMHLDNRCNGFWAHGQRARMEDKKKKRKKTSKIMAVRYSNDDTHTHNQKRKNQAMHLLFIVRNKVLKFIFQLSLSLSLPLKLLPRLNTRIYVYILIYAQRANC